MLLRPDEKRNDPPCAEKFHTETTEDRSMSLKHIASLGKMFAQFLHLFRGCFSRPAGRLMLAVYVRGLLSNIQKKNAEAIARDQNVAPRTLQRFLESIVWDEGLLRDECQRLIAAEHAHPDAIGCVDETVTTKSGNHTAGVKRQYNGNRGTVENCINNVALSYTSNDFHCLLDAQLNLPKECVLTRRAEKKLQTRRYRIQNEAPNRTRSNRSREGQWYSREGYEF